MSAKKFLFLTTTVLTRSLQHGAVLADLYAQDGYCPYDGVATETPDESKQGDFGGKLKTDDDVQINTKCGVYLAESSIPGAGLGFYTGRDITAGGSIGSYLDSVTPTPALTDVCIAIVDMEEDADIIQDYDWVAGEMGTEFEGEDEIRTLCPGLGMGTNGHMLIHNVKMTFPSVDDGGLHRYGRPGAGAITHYHNVGAQATMDIEAGTELFLDYGTSYFKSRKKIFERDIADAEGLTKILFQGNSSWTAKSKTKVLDKFREVLKGNRSDYKNEAKVPGTAEEEQFVSFASESSAMQAFFSSKKAPEWLQQNGMCADNLRAGPSTNPQAGRGAFAIRHIPKGSLIAPAQMLYFPQSDEVFDEDWPDDVLFEMTYDDENGERDGLQLFINYCFGHPDSSVLMFPYSPMVNLINHNSTAPNAEIHWSNSTFNKKHLLETDVDDLDMDGGSGLLLEYIALADIQPGEEIFIDYGPEWEGAWNDHMKNWKPKPETQNYVSAADFNRANKDKAIRTRVEQEDVPYPKNIKTACFFEFPSNFTEQVDKLKKSHNWARPRLKVKWNQTDTFDEHYYLRLCDVLHRQNINGMNISAPEGNAKFKDEDSQLYTAKVWNEPEATADDVPGYSELVVTDIPRHAIIFVDEVQSTDQHLEGTFRHPIGMPNRMFPMIWKNRPN